MDAPSHEGGAISISPGPLGGVVRAPASKSVTNRLLVMAALAAGESRIWRPLVSDDTRAMGGGLSALGAPVNLSAERAAVAGSGGRLHPTGEVIEAGLSGTTLRFLAAAALLATKAVTLDGGAGLRSRPLGGLLAALAATGASVESDRGHAPVTLDPAGLPGGRLVVDARQSSQFATALLLVAPYARSDTELVVENLGAGGYLDLTLDLMAKAGADVTSEESTYFVGRGSYTPLETSVEYDASAAAHLFAAAVASGGAVTVDNAAVTKQPDAEAVRLLAEMGAELSPAEGGGLRLGAPAAGLSPVRADLSGMPDQLATFATLAALARGESRFSGIEVSRGHETDRPTAVATELARLGAEVSLERDELRVRGGRKLSGGRIETYGDHRMAMGFAALGTAVAGITIADPGCVAKTYPGFWADLRALGAKLSF